MRISIISLIVLAFLSACGGDSSSTNSATSDRNTLVRLSEVFISPPAAGNGIWNYSVATDYFFGSRKLSPSLYSDITKYDPNHTAIQYVFPVFGNIQAGTANNYVSNPMGSSACRTQNAYSQAVFSYYALPLENDRLITGSYPTSPYDPTGPFSRYIGACVSGLTVTDYYKNTVKIPYVVPVVEIPSFSSFIGSPSSAAIGPPVDPTQVSLGIPQVLNIANAVAEMIISDPNAYGVGFDNEPAINKATSSANAAIKVNCQGMYYEQLFYGAIAAKLAQASPPKYLFLFDAPDTGNSLYQGITTMVDPSSTSTPPQNCALNSASFPPLTYGPLKNIVLQKPLYDLGDTTNLPANGPISLSDNIGLTTQVISSYLGMANGPPVTFVLPASATSTMWDSLQIYNLPTLRTQLATNPSLYPTSISIQSASRCNQDALTISSINYQVLSQFLCADNSSNSCLTPSSSLATIRATIEGFIGTNNCGSFTNQTTLQSYFAAGLPLITRSTTSQKKQPYLGSSLYAWRIKAMSDIEAAPSYYSLDGPSNLPPSIQLFPMDISDGVWNDFISWAEKF